MLGAMRTAFIGAAGVVEEAAPSRTAKTLSAYGNAQVDTAQSKFGGASALFDGNSDAIKVTSGLTDFEGSGDFTYEFFIRSSNIGGRFAVVDQRHTSNSASTFNIFFWDGALQMYQNGFASLGGTWSNNTWYHVAITKSGTTYKGYQNGTLIGTWSSGAGTIPTVGEFNIALANDEVNWDYSGHLDEIRVSNVVRYTSNFTAPTDVFENDADTLLLIHCDGADGSTTFEDDATAPSVVTFRSDTYASNVVLAVPFDDEHGMDDQSEEINSGSTQATLTDGPASSLSTAEVKWSTPDYVNSYLGTMGVGQANTYTPSTAIPGAGGTTAYVVEGWFNAKNGTSNSNWCLSSADSGGRWLFGINNGSTFSFGNENNIGIGTGWHHLAIVSESGSKRFYYDGIYKGAWVSSNSGFSVLHVGQFNAGDPNDYRGHIQDLKVTIGSNRGYTGTNSSSANFTLPSSIVESY